MLIDCGYDVDVAEFGCGWFGRYGLPCGRIWNFSQVKKSVADIGCGRIKSVAEIDLADKVWPAADMV